MTAAVREADQALERLRHALAAFDRRADRLAWLLRKLEGVR